MRILNKGISPLIAGVLLIAFTLAVAAIIGGWLTSTVREETTQVGTGFALQVNCTKAALDIIDAVCVTNNITIGVSNTGPISVKSPSIYARATDETPCIVTYTDTIAPGSSVVFRNNCGFTGKTLQFVRVSANCQDQVAIIMEKNNIGDAC